MDLNVISCKFTEKTIEQIVKGCGADDVSHWQLSPRTGRGDSYLSELNRMQITGTKGNGDDIQIHAVIKALPKQAARRQTFRSVEFFDKEIEFYDHIWPAFEKLQLDYNVPGTYTDVAKCDFIALADLSVDGFSSADRQVELDVPHCKLALESLGKFHGLSFAMKSLQPDKFAQISSNMVDIYYSEEARSWYEDMAGIQIVVARDAVHKEYAGTEIEEKMYKFTENAKDFYTKMVQLTHTINKNAVIGHGDCWLPNFMFKYGSNGIPECVKIIDFQLVRLGSCALDISFFLYSCTSDALRESHYEEMLKWYYSGLSQLLVQFKLDPAKVFPFSSLIEEMEAFACFGLGMGMESLPLSIMDEEDTTDMDSVQGDRVLSLSEIWKIKPIADKAGRCRLADIFKHAVKYKYL